MCQVDVANILEWVCPVGVAVIVVGVSSRCG